MLGKYAMCLLIIKILLFWYQLVSPPYFHILTTQSKQTGATTILFMKYQILSIPPFLVGTPPLRALKAWLQMPYSYYAWQQSGKWDKHWKGVEHKLPEVPSVCRSDEDAGDEKSSDDFASSSSSNAKGSVKHAARGHDNEDDNEDDNENDSGDVREADDKDGASGDEKEDE